MNNMYITAEDLKRLGASDRTLRIFRDPELLEITEKDGIYAMSYFGKTKPIGTAQDLINWLDDLAVKLNPLGL